MKKFSLGVFVSLFIVAFFASNACAANAWYTVTVDKIGYSTAGVATVNVTDTAGAFTNKACNLPELFEKEFLAIILTARSLNSALKINIDTDITPRPDINGMYMESF